MAVVGIRDINGSISLPSVQTSGTGDFFSSVSASASTPATVNTIQATATMVPIAGSASTTSTPLSIISGISRVVSGSSTVYQTITVPTTIDGRATSVVFVMPTVITNTSSVFFTPPAKHSTGRIVAGVLTSIVILVCLISLLLYYRKRKLSRQNTASGANDSLESMYLSSGQGQPVGSNSSRREAAPKVAAAQNNPLAAALQPFQDGPSAYSAPDTPASSTDMSHGSTLSGSRVSLAATAVTLNTNERGSEKGTIPAPSIVTSTNNFISPLPQSLDEKHAPVPYVLQWAPPSASVPPIPASGSSASQDPHHRQSSSPSPPPLQRSLSFLLSDNRRTSTIAPSIAPSEAAPAYYPAPNSASRMHFRYRSGASTLTTATESIPPAYEYEYIAGHAPPVPPLPVSVSESASVSGSGVGSGSHSASP
ncbi:hypothetical protein CVT25_003569 [Psilocybe cyanescens]|uniref:Uncharacterized protein n=1 Tax=Psilocybe cyanescens TaxID=93625 RepID=A0A409WNY7_PSICY|nr:hypothetical protein CVT25_003569 [Psilocybe cyanescens]